MAARFSLLSGHLVSQRGRSILTEDWQQSKTRISEDTQHLCKEQHCSPALTAPTVAPPWLDQLLAFLVCDGSGLCQGTAEVQE